MTYTKGIGGHQSARSRTDEWLTPPGIIKKLGAFDLDPCAPIARPWPTAARHLTVEDDGLAHRWKGRVWLNPPYGQSTGEWMMKMAVHNYGTALLFARTETEMFHMWGWQRASAMLFLRGRIHFHRVDGSRAPANAGGPSVLIAYGGIDATLLRLADLPGHFVTLGGSP